MISKVWAVLRLILYCYQFNYFKDFIKDLEKCADKLCKRQKRWNRDKIGACNKPIFLGLIKKGNMQISCNKEKSAFLIFLCYSALNVFYTTIVFVKNSIILAARSTNIRDLAEHVHWFWNVSKSQMIVLFLNSYEAQTLLLSLLVYLSAATE